MFATFSSFSIGLLKSHLQGVFARNAGKPIRLSRPKCFLKPLTFVVEPSLAGRTGNPFSSIGFMYIVTESYFANTTRSRVFTLLLLLPWLLNVVECCIIQSFCSSFLFNLGWSRRLLFSFQGLQLRLHDFLLDSLLIWGTCKNFSLLRFVLASLSLFTFGVWRYIKNMYSLFSTLRSDQMLAVIVICSWYVRTWICDCRHWYGNFRIICCNSWGTWWRDRRKSW